MSAQPMRLVERGLILSNQGCAFWTSKVDYSILVGTYKQASYQKEQMTCGFGLSVLFGGSGMLDSLMIEESRIPIPLLHTDLETIFNIKHNGLYYHRFSIREPNYIIEKISFNASCCSLSARPKSSQILSIFYAPFERA